MEPTMKRNDAAMEQMSYLENQLSMFAKIKELYNVDFDLQTREIEKRVDRIRLAINYRDNIKHAI